MPNKGIVLIVDDQPHNVKLMAGMLCDTGYEVVKAYCGEDALNIVHEFKPDIILLDIMMPGLNGYEVTEILKKNPKTSDIPIVLVTALNNTEDMVKGLNYGADDFLTKPVNRAEILARVHSMVKLKRLQDELKKKMKFPQPPHGISPQRHPKDKSMVMVIEDNEKTAKQITVVLDSAGYNTVAVSNGKQALELLDEAIPDIILLDLMLPDINGIELLGQFKSNGLTTDIPVIMITVISELDAKIQSLETGADDYLVKPVNSLELLARVKAVLRKHEAQEKLRSSYGEAVTKSITDALTGLYNRLYLEDTMKREIAHSKRYGETFSIMMFDIDHFKKINDSLGHLVGDNVLKDMGLLIKQSIRDSDIAARYGGEEFVVVMSNAAVKTAMDTAERFRETVASHNFSGVEKNKVTISIGVTELQPDDKSMNDVIKRADDALYKAKQEGRNVVRHG